MRLGARLVLFIALASLVPLGLLGLGATRDSSRLLLREVSRLQGSAVDGLAVFVETWMGLQLRLIEQQAGTFPLEQLSDRELEGYLHLVYRQTLEAHVVTLTGLDGIDVAPGVFLRSPASGSLAARDVVSPERYLRFREGLPLADLAQVLATLPPDVPPSALAGQPYVPPDRSLPVVPVAMAVPGAGHVLGIELGLDPIVQRVEAQSAAGQDVALLDAAGRPVIGTGRGLVVPEVFDPFLGTTPAEDIRYRTTDGATVVAACAPIRGLGWTAVIAEPVEASRAAVEEIRRRTGYYALVAAVLSLVVGTLLARQVSRPVIALRDAALAVAEGDLGRRVGLEGRDELTEMARAFNFMSTRLKRNADEIARQQAEIEAFNRELQQRVEERTRELREAQDRLVASARLAAVGEMGSGLAHELNNPIAGILGLTQVVLASQTAERSAGMLRSIEEQALRCKDIVSRLLRFSQQAPDGSAVDRGDLDVVDVDDVLRDVLTLVRTPFRQRGVEVDHLPGQAMDVKADRGELGRAFAQLLTSIRGAAHGGGMLSVGSRREDGEVVVEFTLSGPGIVVGSDDWMASGMGFWAARKVFDEHGGRLVEPRAGSDARRATWQVRFPEA